MKLKKLDVRGQLGNMLIARRPPRTVPPGSLKCNTCKDILALSEFGKDADKKICHRCKYWVQHYRNTRITRVTKKKDRAPSAPSNPVRLAIRALEKRLGERVFREF